MSDRRFSHPEGWLNDHALGELLQAYEVEPSDALKARIRTALDARRLSDAQLHARRAEQDAAVEERVSGRSRRRLRSVRNRPAEPQPDPMASFVERSFHETRYVHPSLGGRDRLAPPERPGRQPVEGREQTLMQPPPAPVVLSDERAYITSATPARYRLRPRSAGRSGPHGGPVQHAPTHLGLTLR